MQLKAFARDETGEICLMRRRYSSWSLSKLKSLSPRERITFVSTLTIDFLVTDSVSLLSFRLHFLSFFLSFFSLFVHVFLFVFFCFFLFLFSEILRFSVQIKHRDRVTRNTSGFSVYTSSCDGGMEATITEKMQRKCRENGAGISITFLGKSSLELVCSECHQLGFHVSFPIDTKSPFRK